MQSLDSIALKPPVLQSIQAGHWSATGMVLYKSQPGTVGLGSRGEDRYEHDQRPFEHQHLQRLVEGVTVATEAFWPIPTQGWRGMKTFQP